MILRIILFILVFCCFSAFSQRCNTFQSVDYQFGFAENKQAGEKSPLVTLKKINQNRKPNPPVTTTSEVGTV